MKIDFKKRSVQLKYRQTLEQQKKRKKYTLEAAITVCLLILAVLLNIFYSDKTSPENNLGADLKFRVIPHIDQVLETTSPFYMGIAIDHNPQPVKIILKTFLQEANTEVEEMQLVVHQMVAESLPNKQSEDYEIIILGKDKTELKRELFNLTDEF